ncbi:MAG: ATP-binding cassette domain-containing protein [archaeon]
MLTIQVKDLKKVYKTHEREPGLINAIKSLVNRKYEIKEALKGITFEVEEGEILGLIGPNGAGKSTVLKILSGVLYPDSGYVNVLNFVPWKDRVKYVKNIGVVFGQKEQLWWDLPAIDTFYLHKELYDIKEPDFKNRLENMIKILNVEDIIKTPVRDLSLGERMKCKIIAALLHNPKLVFLDEPSIGLDVIAKDNLRDFIKDINTKYKTTFIITTHDMQDIERLCERIIIINHGEIIYNGLLSMISNKFIKTKIIDVKFEDKFEEFNFKGCKVLEKKDYELKIEMEIGKQTVKDLINYLLSNFKVADINIEDPPIEEIIKLIYKDD